MTFRAKPVVKRSQRPSWESHDRRNFYLNLGFAIVVVAAIVVLVVVAGASYYNAHLASVGSVAGQSITKDEWNDRATIENWRLTEAISRVRTEQAAGRLTQAQADSQTSFIQQQQQQLSPLALERIIDNRIQAGLAASEGITVTDGDVDARLTTEATTPEQRHAWEIVVAPTLDTGASDPTAAQTAAAKAKADAALADLQAGKDWATVAKSVSTDAASAPQGGDIGWIQKDDSSTDPALLTALFAGAANTPTAVIEGADGTFRIGRVTEIAPESVDGSYTDRLVNDGIDLARYRTVVRGDVIRDKLQDKVVADATAVGPQRHVQEIYMQQSAADLPATAVRVRHILYSPKDDPEHAQDGTIPADDPSWATAEADARAAYAKLQADPTQFDAIARAESDETSARGITGTGGKLPGYVTDDGQYVKEFQDAVLKPGLADGTIIEPFKSPFGWHVVQIVNHPTDQEHLQALKTQADGGADFGTLARDNSDGKEAGKGGDLGFVAQSQLKDELSAAIFATPIGGTSDVVTVKDDGTYLFKVLAEETRTPEGAQLADIKANAFSEWYTVKKAAVDIQRDPAITGTTG